MRIALYQPEIAGNVGAIMRLAACFGVPLDIVMPCGFAFSDRHLKRAAMDYGAATDLTRHASYEAFLASRKPDARIVLMTGKGAAPLHEIAFRPDDILLMGNEGHGVPDPIHASADLRVRIPMVPGFRSLNISVATGIALSEALRQTGQFPQ
jgi:tRNA (cytidine/uridine-2'-O-)-methyltransferase